MKPLLGVEEEEAIVRMTVQDGLLRGRKLLHSSEFARAVNAKHAVAVSSCTSALHLALKALKVTKNDEVIVPSHSFIASANAIHSGAIPCFVDIDPITFNLDPSKIQSAINPQTKAILCVHQMGMPSNLEEILKISKSGVPIIEDAACAIGSKIRLNKKDWECIGKPHGVVAAFSFHPRKVITTGDGGMLTTNDDSINRKFRLWRQHRMSVPDSVRHNSNEVIFESYQELGYNYRMTDLQASLGREQLKKLEAIVKKREEIASFYEKAFLNCEDVKLPKDSHYTKSNWQSFCVRLLNNRHELKYVMQALLEKVYLLDAVSHVHTRNAYSKSLGHGLAKVKESYLTSMRVYSLNRSAYCSHCTMR